MKDKIVYYLSVIVFYLGCAVVFVYVRLRDLFVAREGKKMVAHVSQYPYPTWNQTSGDLEYFYNAVFDRESLDKDCAVKAGQTVLSFGLSRVFPHPQLVGSAPAAETIPDADAQKLAALVNKSLPAGAQMSATTAVGLDWWTITLAVMKLLEGLRNR